MPIYRFACKECGYQFEELTAYDRRSEVRCPVCKGETNIKVSTFATSASGGAPAAAPSGSRFT